VVEEVMTAIQEGALVAALFSLIIVLAALVLPGKTKF